MNDFVPWLISLDCETPDWDELMVRADWLEENCPALEEFGRMLRDLGRQKKWPKQMSSLSWPNELRWVWFCHRLPSMQVDVPANTFQYLTMAEYLRGIRAEYRSIGMALWDLCMARQKEKQQS